MNMNRGLVNRAILTVGQMPLTDEDVQDKTTAYQTYWQYYLATFLEALSEAEWSGGRKREELVRTGRPVLKDMRFAYAYDIPFDCAKPIELQNNEYFVVEDRILYTDVFRPQLLYVSNGKILRPVASVLCGKPGDSMDMEYLTAGQPWTESEVTLVCGGPGDLPPEDAAEAVPPPDPEPAEDYPDYRQTEYEPKFYEYVEKTLAAKAAMKMSEQPQLHLQLLQEALLIKQEAVRATKIRQAAKLEPRPWWGEELGLC
ncbi:MAG: hypothetical protein LBB77_04765 [Treponema sp.]|nr:hypothetical protein [Treponema sp.]